MTTEPNRQPEGIPTGGQFATKIKSDDVVSLSAAPSPAKTMGDVLGDQYLAAKERYEAHRQNEWAAAVQSKYPDAAYAYVAVTNDRGGRYTAGMGLYDAAGEELDVDEADAVGFEGRFDVFWDMGLHETDNSRAIFTRDSEVFSLASVKGNWEKQAAAAPAVDPFAHLTGMDKAKAQGAYARELSSEAAAAYVDDISAKLMAANPASARLYFNRRADVESGLTFDMDRVEDVHRNAVDVDLSAMEDTTFQDGFLDGHLDFDEGTDELYLNLDPGK